MCGHFLSPGRVLQPSLGNVRRVLDQQVGFLSFGLVEGAEDVVGGFQERAPLRVGHGRSDDGGPPDRR